MVLAVCVVWVCWEREGVTGDENQLQWIRFSIGGD